METPTDFNRELDYINEWMQFRVAHKVDEAIEFINNKHFPKPRIKTDEYNGRRIEFPAFYYPDDFGFSTFSASQKANSFYAFMYHRRLMDAWGTVRNSLRYKNPIGKVFLTSTVEAFDGDNSKKLEVDEAGMWAKPIDWNSDKPVRYRGFHIPEILKKDTSVNEVPEESIKNWMADRSTYGMLVLKPRRVHSSDNEIAYAMALMGYKLLENNTDMDQTKILSDSAEDMGIKPKVSLWKKFLCLIKGHDWDWNIKMCAPERTCKRCKKKE